MQDFKNLEVWKLSFELGKEIYRITSKFPKEEAYSLTSQLRRSALSVSANIAEGTGKDSDKDFLRFLRISMGSLKETENFILMSEDLEFISREKSEYILKKIQAIGIKLNNFIKILKVSIEKEAQKNKLAKAANAKTKNLKNFSASKGQARSSKQQSQRFC